MKPSLDRYKILEARCIGTNMRIVVPFAINLTLDVVPQQQMDQNFRLVKKKKSILKAQRSQATYITDKKQLSLSLSVRVTSSWNEISIRSARQYSTTSVCRLGFTLTPRVIYYKVITRRPNRRYIHTHSLASLRRYRYRSLELEKPLRSIRSAAATPDPIKDLPTLGDVN